MELLKQLYRISSPSGKEKKMRKFIKDWVRKNVPDAIVEIDKTGNIYVTRGEAKTYPCVVAHIDQVQDPHEKDFKVYLMKGKLFGFSESALKMRGLGADDKNGIWVALKCLKKYDVFKCAFFVGEEVGCVGSSDADMDFFDDCRWVIQCDRKNGGDLITEASCTELCSEEFVEAIQPKKFGYKETHGLMTDVMTLKENGLKVSCVNMSCGYYRPHTDEEYTDWNQLQNCLRYVQWIAENVTDVYPHEYEGFDWKKYQSGNYYKYPFGAGSEYGRYGGYGSYGQYGGSGYYGSRGGNTDHYGLGKAWDKKEAEKAQEPVELVMTDDDEIDENLENDIYDAIDSYLMNYPEADAQSVAYDISYHYPDVAYDKIVKMCNEMIAWYR